MSEHEETSVEAIAKLAEAGVQFRDVEPGEIVAAVLRPGWSVQTYDAESAGDAPRRLRGVTNLGDVESFLAHVAEFGGGLTRLERVERYTWRAPYNGPKRGADESGWTAEVAEPGWDDFAAVLDVKLSRQFQRWIGHDGLLIGPVEFAEMLEDRIGDIADPDAADLIEMAQTLEGRVDAQWQAGHRLKSGARNLVYSETVTAHGRTLDGGEMRVPDSLVLRLPVLEHGPEETVAARLRYRVVQGKLSIGYQIIDLDGIIDTAAAAITEQLIEATGLPVLNHSWQR